MAEKNLPKLKYRGVAFARDGSKVLHVEDAEITAPLGIGQAVEKILEDLETDFRTKHPKAKFEVFHVSVTRTG